MSGLQTTRQLSRSGVGGQTLDRQIDDCLSTPAQLRRWRHTVTLSEREGWRGVFERDSVTCIKAKEKDVLTLS